MKPLPEDPPVYQRPPERWFEIHEHETVSGKPSEKMAAIVRTRQAMLLTFLDYTGLPLEKTDKPMPAALGNLCSAFISANNKPSCMSVWRELCKNATLKEEETPEKLFVRLLQTGFNDRSHEGSGLTGNQQLPVDLSSIGRLKATCPIFEDGHGDHGY